MVFLVEVRTAKSGGNEKGRQGAVGDALDTSVFPHPTPLQ